MNAQATDLKCDARVNPLGIDEPRPSLSWRIVDDRKGARQTAWQIRCATTPEKLTGKADLWDTGRRKGSDTIGIRYGGKKLSSRTRVWWTVQTWDHAGKALAPSEPAWFEMGLLSPRDWKAKWIGDPQGDVQKGTQPSPLFRTEFSLPFRPVSARLYVTSRGSFEIHLNGQRVGEDYFTPGWTDYKVRIPYLVYDVTAMLQKGPNALGGILADGWYAGYLVWKNHRCLYGDSLSLLAQLEVTGEDGKTFTLGTRGDWKAGTGAIRASDHYNGETYDARLHRADWATAGFDDSAWATAPVVAAPKASLTAKIGGPVRRQETLAAVALTEPVANTWIFDLGQNMVGWARVRLSGKTGDTITLRYAEMLQADGTPYVENLRSAKCTDSYICAGTGVEVWEPSFTFHGFRYVEITGLAKKPGLKDVEGIVLHSDIPAIGEFDCSDPLVNRLQKNILWGQKGNFFEVPTDCPQRDERLGWTGDAQVFIRTACFNRDVSSFFSKWLLDVADAQLPNGAVPHVVPNVLGETHVAAAAWADAAVICPWTVYLCYGDKQILERQYESMAKWVQWQQKNSPGLVNKSACFGDWLAIDIAENNAGRSPTPRDLIATAYFAHTAAIVSQAAKVLGKSAEAAKYGRLAKAVTAAWNRHFVTPEGRVVGDTQTGYLLGLGFDLIPKTKQKAALAKLVSDIQGRGWHLSTGFVGTPLLAPVLTKLGRADVAFHLLLQKTYPSWLYPIEQGATTMWERWNSYTKEKGFGDVGMNSFNHYAYGAIGEWLYASVAGLDLDPDEPGYRHLIIHPHVGGGLSHARASLKTPHGSAASSWKITGKRLTLEVTVPPNCRATVTLPGGVSKQVTAGTHRFEKMMK